MPDEERTEQDIPIDDAETAEVTLDESSEPVASPDAADDGFFRPVPEDDGFYRPPSDDDSEEAATPEAPPAPPADPYISLMLRVALSLIVVLLATTGALVYYLNTLNRAPRTAAERDIITWETAVLETPKSAEAWSRLSYAYAAGGRYDEALDAVAEGKKRTKQPVFSLIRADVLRTAGRYAEAKDAYDEAEKAVTDALADVKRKRQKLRIKFDVPDESMGRVYSGRAVVLHELGDDKAAIEDLEAALKLEPQQSALWVLLGDYRRSAGDKDGAKTAYKNALKYIPDYQEALAGLESLEKDTQ